MKNITYIKNSTDVPIFGIALFFSYLVIFFRFFPNKYGLLGHDYALVLPALLDNFIWFFKNSLLEVPWFTPSFCGGFLNFTHPLTLTYSLPSLLFLFFDPLSVVLMTFLLFALLGFSSSYLLLRSGFHLSKPSAFFGAGLFLFNGFYSHRMLIGHFGFHCFMIIPLLIFLLIRPIKNFKNSFIAKQVIFDIFAAGILFAYMVHTGYLTLMLPSILAIIIIGLIHGLLFPDSKSFFWLRLVGSGLTGILLSSSRLVTISYIMDNITRSDYMLPGADSFFSSAWLIFKSLFSSPAFDAARIGDLVNQEIYLDRHEWEYSLTIVPLLIIIWALIKFGLSIKKREINKDLALIKRHSLRFIMLAILLIIPVALNTYSPSWNALLKQIPIIKSASSLIRWYILYIPFICLITSLVIERMVRPKIKWPIVIAGMLIVVGFNTFTDHEFYHNQAYDPQDIQNSYTDLKNGSWTPEIKYIVLCVNEEGQIIRPADSNDTLIDNGSQLICYEPLLGYRLEHFPIKTLHPGPVLDENQGVLNIKNPACYVWPEANSCNPGDHFTVDQIKEAEKFVQYRSFNFNMPAFQKFANWFNLLFLASVVLYLGFYLIAFLVTSRKKGIE
jgi:hypothetical protein